MRLPVDPFGNPETDTLTRRAGFDAQPALINRILYHAAAKRFRRFVVTDRGKAGLAIPLEG